MTELIYQVDAYGQAFEATVAELDPGHNCLALDRTAFYPGGGGQPCDLGHLQVGADELAVTRVKSQQGAIWHWVEGELPETDSPVTGQLDWDRRLRLMRTHTALHILCGVVWRDYGAQVTGGNMEPLKGRMDFEFESLHKELVQEIQERVNAEVEAARDVRVSVLPREEAFQIPDLIRTKINLLPKGIQQVRVVEIAGLDLQADGGTHVSNTCKVGRIHIDRYQSKGRINKRIYITLDD